MELLLAQGVTEPPVLVSPLPPWVWLALFGTTALTSVSLATYWSITRRDPIPLLSCIGAAVCALNEPIFDVLGKIVYAENNIMAYSAFGRDIPVFLVIGYIAWVGLLPYVIARGMQAGWSARRLYAVSIAGVTSVWGVEAVNLFIHGWSYYGDPPLKFFGGVAAMASVPLAAAFLLYALGFTASGWRRCIAGFFVPLFSLPMMFAGTGWPLYLALHSDLPLIVDYLAIGALILLIVVANVAIVRLTVTWRRSIDSRIDAPVDPAVPMAHHRQDSPTPAGHRLS
ncbi:hypothetical protein ACQI4L_03070 [Mycolicibacterium litorale]|uniref:hypothetical protein n=1 Tax=Mycolicibacterium litorale TaxID=758802 RepID=UPI003CFB6BBB